ncbi:hypothetical protein EZV62_020714 [Acer yangbiense]|uniref:Gnk2-homologous domain-containing protein n=1 Tax=Acer yangbiense TaxID=1000413 RepID=A0A5C7HFF2_9ROSI|nr:hypothetical protein EZV62_020714 [Acer yangbiense]
MGFMYSLSVLSYVLISISFTTGQKCCDTGNFTTNDTYGNNRNHILSSLATNVQSNNGFFTDSTGEVLNEVHALAICRGDLTLIECARCINSTSQDIMIECHNQKEAFMWGTFLHCALCRSLFFWKTGAGSCTYSLQCG